MRTRFIEQAAWVLTALAVVAAVRTWRGITRPAEAAAPAIWPVSRPATLPTPDSVSILVGRIVSDDAFRLDRKPADVAYGATTDSGAAHAGVPPAAPRPPLVLVGIVGPPWRALVDGIPGHDASSVVRAGQTVDGLAVRAITSTTATITGMDTTWHLTVKRATP